MGKLTATPTGDRNAWGAVTRALRVVWYGENSSVNEIPPIALNNEAIRAPNAAGTAYVDIIKVNGSNLVEIPTQAKISAALEVTGAITPTGGTAQIAGTGVTVPEWVCGMRPVALTDGTSTQGVAKQQFLGPVNVKANCTITGVAFLIGTTGGTDYAIVSLYSTAGVLLAQSVSSSTAAGGTLVGTAANLQAVPFTATYTAKGPSTYWVGVQYSGTTAFIRTVPLGMAASGIHTAATYAPDASVTLPTSFTAATAPVACVY